MGRIRKNVWTIIPIIVGIITITWFIFYVSSCARNAMSFPLPTLVVDKNKEVSTKLFTFNLNLGFAPGDMVKEAIEKMDKEGYRPATLAEGWTFKDKISDIKKVLPIACLGDVRWSFPYSFNVGIIRLCGFGEAVCGSHEADITGGTYYFLGIQK